MIRSNLSRKAPVFFISFLAASMLAPVSSAVIVNETFPAGDRLVQNLPNTAAWYATGGPSGTMPTLSNPEGSLTVDMTDSAQILTYFTNGAPVSLAVGEILEVTFSFQMTGAASQGVGVRTAVVNSSGGARVEDASGTSSGAFNGYTGYGGWFNPGGSPTTIRERINLTDNRLLSNAAVWPSQESRSGSINILDDNVYIGSYLIERTIDSVLVTFGLSGPNFADFTFSYNDIGSTLTSFDTFGIWLNAGAGDSFSLTGFDVAVIPEPSSIVLVLGIAAGALIVFRRRRSSDG